jgi:hypothetical protein
MWPEFAVTNLVDFDTGDNVLLNENVHYLLTINGGLVEGFLKEDGTGDELAKARNCHKQGPVSLAVSFSVL